MGQLRAVLGMLWLPRDCVRGAAGHLSREIPGLSRAAYARSMAESLGQGVCRLPDGCRPAGRCITSTSQGDCLLEPFGHQCSLLPASPPPAVSSLAPHQAAPAVLGPLITQLQHSLLVLDGYFFPLSGGAGSSRWPPARARLSALIYPVVVSSLGLPPAARLWRSTDCRRHIPRRLS